MAGQNMLSNVYSRSFPGKNLFEVSLVKDNDPQLPFYKPKFFCFVSMTPGINNQGSRTFSREGKVTIKADCEKIIALAHSLRFHARGQDQFGKFSIFADSSKNNQSQGQLIKQCFVSTYMSQPKQQNEEPTRWISLSMRAGNNQPFGNSFSSSEAIAVADILEIIGKLGIDEDMKARLINSGTPSSAPVRQSAPNQSSSEYQQAQPPQMNMDTVQNNFANAMTAANGNGYTPPSFAADAPFD